MILMKLKCPLCSHEFPPQEKNNCPECGKFINIPKKYKPGYDPKAEAEDKKKRTSRKSSSDTPKRSYAQPATNPIQAVSQNGKFVFLLFLVFGIFLFLNYGAMQKDLEEGAAEPRVDGRPLLADQDLYRIRTALELFKASCYRYPTQKEGLRALIEDPGLITWDGPYMTTLRPDPWLGLYRYYLEDGEVILYSTGPDREDGTEDDIQAPEPMPMEEWPDHWLRDHERKRLGLPPVGEKNADTNAVEEVETTTESTETEEDPSEPSESDTPVEETESEQKETADQSEDQPAVSAE